MSMTPQAPTMYVIAPPVVTMRVPILRNPAVSNEMLGMLHANTVVQSAERVQPGSALWLPIYLSQGSVGYVQRNLVRPATPAEVAASQGRGGVAFSGAPMRPVQPGLVQPRRVVARTGSAGALLMGALFLCAIGTFLGRGVETQECNILGCTTVGYPFEALGGFFLFMGCLALVAAFVMLVVTWTQGH